MRRNEKLSFINVITLGGNSVFISNLTEAVKAIHADGNLAGFSDIEKIKQQLETKNYNFLVIDLQAAGDEIKQFISFCKRKLKELAIIVVGNADDISLLKDFFKIGINAYVSPDVTGYELKIALLKSFSGENYVGTTISGKLANSYLTSHS